MNDQPLTKSLAIEKRINTAITAETAMAPGAGLIIDNMMQAIEVAKLMAISGKAVRKHFRDSPGTCLGIVIQAMEWRMSPFAVANKSYEVNDQIAFESQLVQAVILARAPIKDGIDFTFKGEGTSRSCTATAMTLSGRTVSVDSPKIMDIKPKNSPLWFADPDQQLSYYTGRALCRRYFPNVLLGIYAVDELEPDMKDASPKDSGLVGRMKASAAAEGGFNADGVAAALEEAGSDGIDWTSAEQATSALAHKILPPGCSFEAGVLTVPEDFDQPGRGSSVVMGRFGDIRTTSGRVLKSKDGPAPRYFYHPESEAFVITSDGSRAEGDGHLEEIDKDRFFELQAKLKAERELNPEMERAGAQAFVDGEERRVPDGLAPDDAVAWLRGYDAVKGGA